MSGPVIVNPPPRSGAAPGPGGQVIPLPESVPQLRGAPTGAIIQATVLSSGASGVVLQTANGQIGLPVTLALRPGQTVLLQVQQGAAGRLLSIQPERPGVATTGVADLLPSLAQSIPLRPGLTVTVQLLRAADGQPTAPPSTVLAGTAGALRQPAPVTTTAPQQGVAASLAPTTQAPTPIPGLAAAQPGVSVPLSPPTSVTSGVATATPLSLTSPPIGVGPSSTPTVATTPLPAPTPAAAPATGTPAPGTPTPATPVPATPAPAANALPRAPAPGATTTPTPAPPIQPGAATAALVTAVAANPGQTTGTASAGPAIAVLAAAQPTAALLGLHAGQRTALRVVAVVAQPNPGAPTIAPTPPPGAFVAPVIATSSAGFPIVQAAGATLVIEGVSAPVGATVTLAPPPAAAAARATPAPVIGPPPPPTGVAQPYPGLPALIAAAAETPGAAQGAVSAILPRVGPAFAAEILFFLRALRTGDVNQWIGREARDQIARAGRGRTVAQVGDELRQGSRAIESAAEWRPFPIPVAVGDALVEPIRLYVRRPEDEDSASGGDANHAKRFLVDVTFGRLGRIQLDGLSQGTKLDLMVRSPERLDGGLQAGVRQFYESATRARGLTGTLIFQVGPMVEPAPASKPSPRSGIVV